MKKIALLSISFVILCVLLFVYRMFNKPHTNVKESQAAKLISAEQLFDYFDRNEDSAMVEFSDQIIQINGTLLSKDLSNELEPQIILKTNDTEGFIRCGFKPSELKNIEILKDSSTVNLKGICKGMNGDDELTLLEDKDVILSSSIIIE
jgi:hypothetical protein